MYGIEGSDVTEKMVAKMAAAVMDVFRSSNDAHDADWMFIALSNGTAKEVDPIVQLLTRRCLELRRAVFKRPGTRAKAQKIRKIYAQKGPNGNEWLQLDPKEKSDNPDDYPCPIQHPTRGTCDTWKKQVGVVGELSDWSSNRS